MKFSFITKDFIEQEFEANKLAIIAENNSYTWSEFETKVNQVCELFKDNNWLNLENPIIIYGHKQAEMIIAIYACIKLEISYIPIDVIYPNERIEIIQKLAKVELVLNCTESSLNLKNAVEIKLNVETIEIVSNSVVKISTIIHDDPIVYVIFTSGSTGEPKGVQISSQAVQTFTDWMTNSFGFTTNDVFINIALFSFDLSVYELLSFGALGSTILLSDKSTTENPDLFLERIDKYKGSIWVSTPSFSFIYSRMENSTIENTVKYFLFCGEMLPNVLAKSLKNNFKNTKIYNTYGPTEATVATTLVEITDEIIENHNPLPVGFPKPNSEILIEENEIIIVGKNVSLGYLNRPELNMEKFVIRNNERAFKTGDYGELVDGMLFCKGRNDDQVKLHGFRIELNEITAKINEIPYVVKAETIALKRNDEVKKIVSLVEIKNNVEKIEFKEDIISQIKKTLPHYMVPSDIKIIPKIPLNQNGKADKKMLEHIYLNKN